MYAYYMHTLDTYMISVCINDNMIMFNVYVTALACFDGYARATTLIIDLELALVAHRLRTYYG